MFNSTTSQPTCPPSLLYTVRLFGVVYFSSIIVFGTIGNILSLLVIQGVGHASSTPRNEDLRQYKPPTRRALQDIPEEVTGRGKNISDCPRNPSSLVSSPTLHTQTLKDAPICSSENLTRMDYLNRQRASSHLPGVFLKRPSPRRHPSRLIFTALAVTDTIVLWVNPPRYWIEFVFHFDLRQNAGVTMCRLHTFLTYATRDAAVWVLCLLTFERYLIAYIPHRAKMIWRGRRKFFCWSLIFLLIAAKNSVLLFILNTITTTAQVADQYDSQSDLLYPFYVDDNISKIIVPYAAKGAMMHSAAESSSKKVICDTQDLLARRVFFYMDIVVYSIIPTILLLFFNIALFRVIHQTGQLRRRYTYEYRAEPAAVNNLISPQARDTPRRPRSFSLTHGFLRNSSSIGRSHIVPSGTVCVKRSVIQANRLLIPVSFFHLVTSIPICIFSIIEDSLQLKRTPSSDVRCLVNACGYLFVMLGTMTYGVNCAIYFLSSRQFRGRLCALGRHVFGGKASAAKPDYTEVDVSRCQSGLLYSPDTDGQVNTDGETKFSFKRRTAET